MLDLMGKTDGTFEDTIRDSLNAGISLQFPGPDKKLYEIIDYTTIEGTEVFTVRELGFDVRHNMVLPILKRGIEEGIRERMAK